MDFLLLTKVSFHLHVGFMIKCLYSIFVLGILPSLCSIIIHKKSIKPLLRESCIFVVRDGTNLMNYKSKKVYYIMSLEGSTLKRYSTERYMDFFLKLAVSLRIN